MIVDGLVLAVITGTAFYFLYAKLPGRVRRYLQRHILLTDTIACLLTYALFGGTLVALFAAAWLSVLVSVLLVVIRNPAAARALRAFSEQITEYKKQATEWLAEKFPPEQQEENSIPDDTEISTR